MIDVFKHPVVRKITIYGLAIWLLCFVIALLFSFFGPVDRAGQFGDTFGAVNALFTMAAMIGASVAVYLQHTELEESRKRQISAEQEREAEKREVAKEREAEKREQRFFELVKLVNHERDQTDMGNGDSKLTEAIKIFLAMQANSHSQDFHPTFMKFDRWVSVANVYLNFVGQTEQDNQKQFFKSLLKSQFSLPQREYLALMSLFADYDGLGPNLHECEIFRPWPGAN